MSTTTGSSSVLPIKSKSTWFSGSVRVWIILAAFLAAAKLFLTVFFPNALADPSQAAFFSWPSLGVFSLLGLVGVLLSERTGFPDAWPANVSRVQRILFRILLPLLVGMAWAVIPVVVDRLTGFTRLVAARHGLEQQYTGFLPMLITFSAAAVLVEVIYRLLIIPLVLWLVLNLLLKKKFQEIIFWILAVLTSAAEPVGQIADLGVVSGLPFFALFGGAFLVNLTQAAFFRRYGFLAAILVRVGYYFVWHALYIH